MKKKEEQKPKRSYPRKYPQEIVDKIVSLIREGKTMDELLDLAEPRKRCLLRIAKRYNLTLKK